MDKKSHDAMLHPQSKPVKPKVEENHPQYPAHVRARISRGQGDCIEDCPNVVPFEPHK